MTRTDLWLPKETLSSLSALAAASDPLETGGLLLGRMRQTSIDVVHAVGPGPTAMHERARFEPDAIWQAQQVAALWNADRTLEYLGDWHTHPEGSTRLSALDRATLRQIASAPGAQQPRPLMVVLALKRGHVHAAAAYQWRSRKVVGVRLRVK